MHKDQQENKSVFADEAVLLAIAEDLRAPLLHIAYAAELAEATGNVLTYRDIQTTAKSAMADIDSLLLGLRATEGQLELPLSPVAPSAIMYEAAQELKSTANLYGCQVFFDSKKQSSLAMLHSLTLRHVICSLGQMLMKTGSGYSRKPELHLMVGGSKKPTLSVMMRGDIAGIIQDIQSRSKKFSTQYSTIMTAGPAAGLRISEQLLKGMEAEIKTIHKGSLHGFQINLLPSTQLNLLS